MKMKKFLLIIVYLIGYFFSYALLKQDFQKKLNRWTQGDRAFVLMVSSFSWITVGAAVAFIIIDKTHFEPNKPASW